MTIDEMEHRSGPAQHVPSFEFWLSRGLPLALTTAILFGFLSLSAFFTLPNNVLAEKRAGGPHEFFNGVAAQNFAFFTKDPQSTAPFAFAVERDGVLRDLSTTPQNTPMNLFGLTRTQRAQGPELATLMNDPKVAWSACGISEAMTVCGNARSTSEAADIKNTSTHPTICGDVVFLEARPVPWGFKDLVPDSYRPVRATHVIVGCRE
ncbi:SdpA family antimicrobial peptide system protein [Leifsonia sp. NPDC058230]|uniref:SdpA family antimicrobial peptide system protein n=1 Tax=Leifsonia sp. NPDC058230 TaxID=3346391 RepID=UPI0036DD85BA